MLQLKFLTGITLLPVGGMTSSNFEGLSPVAQTFDIAWHAVAPVLCIALIQVAVFSRLLRAQMIDFLAQDYIRTASAKGLAEKTVVYRHAEKRARAVRRGVWCAAACADRRRWLGRNRLQLARYHRDDARGD